MPSSGCPACGAPVSVADEQRGECPRCRKPLAVGVAEAPRSEEGDRPINCDPPAHFPAFDLFAPRATRGWGVPRTGLLLLIIWAPLALLLQLAVGGFTLLAVLESRTGSTSVLEQGALMNIGQLPLGLLAMVGVALCCAVPREAGVGGWVVTTITCFACAAGALLLAAAILAYANWGRGHPELKWPFFTLAGGGMLVLIAAWAGFCLLLRRVALHCRAGALGVELLLYVFISLSASFLATVFFLLKFFEMLQRPGSQATVVLSWALYSFLGAGSLVWMLTLFLRLRGRIAAAEAAPPGPWDALTWRNE
jgi:hypothetical protein